VIHHFRGWGRGAYSEADHVRDGGRVAAAVSVHSTGTEGVAADSTAWRPARPYPRDVPIGAVEAHLCGGCSQCHHFPILGVHGLNVNDHYDRGHPQGLSSWCQRPLCGE